MSGQRPLFACAGVHTNMLLLIYHLVSLVQTAWHAVVLTFGTPCAVPVPALPAVCARPCCCHLTLSLLLLCSLVSVYVMCQADAQLRFVEAKTAFETLNDVTLRSEYDRKLKMVCMYLET